LFDSDTKTLLPPNWLSQPLTAIASLAPVQEVRFKPLQKLGICLLIKRDDLLGDKLGGNKLYKLHGHLNAYFNSGQDVPVASFGGAYSNHLYALAAAGQLEGFSSIGIIRGEAPKQYSPTLKDLEQMGMRLHFISRSDYLRRYDTDFYRELEQQLGACFWIPEGGGGSEGARGCCVLAKGLASTLANTVDCRPDLLVHACGTGSSFAGLNVGLSGTSLEGVATMGVVALKLTRLEDQLEYASAVTELMQALDSGVGGGADNWHLNYDFHCGGFAKYPSYLAAFVEDFERQTGVLLDPVYTSKVMWAVYQKALVGDIRAGSCVVAVHSGGLQGRRSLSGRS